MILFQDDWIGAGLRVVIAFGVIFGVFVSFLTLAERKVSAFIQDRLGPNRVGPWGLLQPVADGIKFFFKEEVRPANAHKVLYNLAPFAAIFPAVLAFGVVPFGARKIGGVLTPLQIADLDVGILFLIAIGSLGIFAIILAGWAAGSKYPFFGAIRAGAQLISYEIPLGLSILAVLVLAGSARMSEIVAMQTDAWFILLCPFGFLLFMISMFAETNRLPFDLPEGESEIIGYHAEYSSMKFAMFFMAEYANMFTMSCVAVVLFLGGWEFLPLFGWEKAGALIGIDL